MHDVDEVVESDRSRQPILDVRPNQIGFDAAKPSRRAMATPRQQWFVAQQRAVGVSGILEIPWWQRLWRWN
jgi:hypothetical protein